MKKFDLRVNNAGFAAQGERSVIPLLTGGRWRIHSERVGTY